ncbi:hypothetical protein [Streptomyces sp. NPDC050264]|uniref:hypothetical protein n=1 Tax=Streptomyces sp. NPDC050264 TaxID=3155038 RepID=UPI0034258994
MQRLRWAAGLVVSALALFLIPPVAYAAEPSPHGSLAGSRAGVGRTPPGRPLPAPTFEEAVLPPPPARPEPPVSATPVPSSPRPERPATARRTEAARGTGTLVNVVPLGAGLLLTGLGIGFLALRLRR